MVNICPFGTLLDGRTVSSDSYRYGFQGQERDDEVKGEGNSLNYKYRMHDARVGRFFAVDPLSPKYPYNSSYAFSENSTITFIELEGLERYYAADGSNLGSVGSSNQIRVVEVKDIETATRLIKQSNVKGVNSNNILYYTLSETLTNKSSSVIDKVSKTIYSENKLQKTDVLESKEMIVGLISPNKSKGGHTFYDKENKDTHIEMNVNLEVNGEKLYNDYPTLVNLLFHESLHLTDVKNGTNTTAWTHFEILKKQFKHSTFDEMTVLGKKYLRSVGIGYLSSQEASLRALLHENGYNTEDKLFQNYFSIFKENVEILKKNDPYSTYDPSGGTNGSIILDTEIQTWEKWAEDESEARAKEPK